MFWENKPDSRLTSLIISHWLNVISASRKIKCLLSRKKSSDCKEKSSWNSDFSSSYSCITCWQSVGGSTWIFFKNLQILGIQRAYCRYMKLPLPDMTEHSLWGILYDAAGSTMLKLWQWTVKTIVISGSWLINSSKWYFLLLCPILF